VVKRSGTTGQAVVIAFAPRQGRRTRHDEKKISHFRTPSSHPCRGAM
jgi:hypothetical protein